MIRPIGAFLLLLGFPGVGLAETKDGIYAGFGLAYQELQLTLANSEAAQFKSYGYQLEAGWQFRFGGVVRAEYGDASSINKISSQTYMETGRLTYYAVKIGYQFGKVAFGGGFRQNLVNLKSLSLAGSSYLESKYSGGTPVGFLSLNFGGNDFVRSSIEAQYVHGNLTSENESLPQIEMRDLSIGLRLLFFVD